MPEVGDPTPGVYEPRNRECRQAFEVLAKDSAPRSVLKQTWGGRRARKQQGEGAAEGRTDNWGEVVTR